MLTNLEELCEEDEGLAKALRCAEVVADAGGQPARIADLFDPNVEGLKGLLAPEAFPAAAFCTPPVSIDRALLNVGHDDVEGISARTLR